MTIRWTWLILLLVALALRLPDLGNPLVDLDEQMYLLVGQRMLDGAIPYVDIWDRKPIGLFLIYAASQLIPGDPIVAYQALALAAATATAGVIAAFARRFASAGAALASGVLYLVWLDLIGGRGGQSPVFYNLPIALAALMVVDTWVGRRGRAVPAMLLVGVALQIKPTVVFEGAFFGIALLVASWRRHRSAPRLMADAALYAGAALSPTLIAWASHAAIGHGEAWWFANVRSIFLRRLPAGQPIGERLAGLAIVLTVPLVLAVRGLSRRVWPLHPFIAGWLAVAVVGWLAIPPYFNHYALPLLVPMAIAAAGALEHRAAGVVASFAGVGLLLLSGYPHLGERAAARRSVATLADVIRREAGTSCPFVFQAPPVLYAAAHACLPTRYPFPPHLTDPSERFAIGVDPKVELDRILATRPRVIVVGAHAVATPVDEIVTHEYRAVTRVSGVTVNVRRH